MPYSPSAIFIFSLEPWGDMWYSKHHYAAHLAKRHNVYFVSIPDRWRWTDLFSFGTNVRRTPEGVNVVEYRNNLPLRPFAGRFATIQNRFNAWKLRRLMPKGETLLWSFYPAYGLLRHLMNRPSTSSIYHIVDPYQNMPGDVPLSRSVDLVVAINAWYERYYGSMNENRILIPHGVRSQDREHDPEGMKGFRKRFGRYAVLATGVNRYVNYALLQRVADAHPDLHIVVAGQWFTLTGAAREARETLFERPNVEYLGVLHPDTLKDLIQGAAVGLLAYDFEPPSAVPTTAGRTPLKVLTYLAQRLPVVSTNNSYIPALEGLGHYKANDADQFVRLVGAVGAKTADVDVAAVDSYLDGVEYANLVGRVLDALGTALEQRGTNVRSNASANRDTDARTLVPTTSPVLIASNEGWNGPRYSKHRFALALSTRRKVFFIDPSPPWRPSYLLRRRILERTTNEGITVLSYSNAVPLFGGRLGAFNDRIISARIRKHLARSGWHAPLFWTFDPSRLISPEHLGALISVYHCVDDHTLRHAAELELAERCDHVFCIARDLMPRFVGHSNSIRVVPHGLANEDLTPTAAAPNLPVQPGYGLYIGNINDRHDFALWERMFHDHPDVNWLIVGPSQVTDPKGLALLREGGRSNVHIIGPLPYDQLPSLIAAAGFGFLYMRPDHPANRISSQKVVQFLAQGKPFFCSWFSEYADRQDLVIMNDDPDEAMHQFDGWKRHGDAPGAAEKRLAYAQELRFDHLLQNLPFRF
ncbi:MAG: hypothetical protein JNM62_05700 [Flavobacteriales bacterium]|nr:hypothetical protein [Flavobacteriales bacterium]